MEQSIGNQPDDNTPPQPEAENTPSNMRARLRQFVLSQKKQNIGNRPDDAPPQPTYEKTPAHMKAWLRDLIEIKKEIRELRRAIHQFLKLLVESFPSAEDWAIAEDAQGVEEEKMAHLTTAELIAIFLKGGKDGRWEAKTTYYKAVLNLILHNSAVLSELQDNQAPEEPSA